MTGFTFVHTSDLHLGKGFGQMPEDLRGRLIEARHEVLDRLIQVARDHGAGHILIAGDTFDTTGPSGQVRRQAATVMSGANDIQWWIIPGNHDSLAGEELWRRLDEETGPNVHVLRTPEPVRPAPGVALLPAPWPRQFPGVDLSEWMVDCQTPEDEIRIGLAHGGVVDFGENFDSSATIPPDRDRSARLDYLALGDWHGALEIGPRVRFSGSPERDRFRHTGRGSCTVVTIAGAGQVPQIQIVETGRFSWQAPVLTLTPDEDAAAALSQVLDPDQGARRDILMRVEVQGFLRLSGLGHLDDAVVEAAPDFAYFDMDDGNLTIEYELEDIDLIAPSGALREAADELLAEATGEGLSEEEMQVAQAALNRLWTLVREG
ncbi:DNA repair exonuclease [Shimia sp. SDUM112013]|uniref:metallophosphoesterase family protein n=1 Tax=Shimia sp. SDUM112013 TaxID=3136160 RepID=UPI0032EC94BE